MKRRGILIGALVLALILAAAALFCRPVRLYDPERDTLQSVTVLEADETVNKDLGEAALTEALACLTLRPTLSSHCPYPSGAVSLTVSLVTDRGSFHIYLGEQNFVHRSGSLGTRYYTIENPKAVQALFLP